MSEGGYKRDRQIVLVGDYQNVGSALVAHYNKFGPMTQIVQPLEMHYVEHHCSPVIDALNQWIRTVGPIRRFGGYRYRHVRIDVAAKKERKHKIVPRFLQRVRGEEMFPLPFHRDDWGDVYFPKPINPVFD